MSDPNEYWVNNPLITLVNKALMYDNAIDGAVSAERERIITLLENSCLDHNIYETPCGSFGEAVALIKGDDK